MTGSMTGFGRCQRLVGARNITVELKSVNHRYFEFSARTPRGLTFMEERLKALVSQEVARGKVDLFLSVSADAASDVAVKASTELLQSYLAAIERLGSETGLTNDVTLSTVLRLPDVFTLEKKDIDEEALWAEVLPVAAEAVANLAKMRKTEGEKLCQDVLSKLDTIAALVERVETISPQTVSDYRQRLFSKLSEVLADRSIEEARLLTEAAIFAERVSVDEETVRIKSHIEHFKTILAEEGAVGRKLDFLTQELNREANTIGSKAQNSEVAKIVVDLKSEIEKIREQIQNFE